MNYCIVKLNKIVVIVEVYPGVGLTHSHKYLSFWAARRSLKNIGHLGPLLESLLRACGVSMAPRSEV